MEIMLSPLALGGADGMIATVRDITERKRVEQALAKLGEDSKRASSSELRSFPRSVRTPWLRSKCRVSSSRPPSPDSSQRALEGAVLATLLDEAVRLVPAILGCEFCKVMELLPDGKALFLRAGTGWKKQPFPLQVPSGEQSQEGFTLLSNEPVSVEDLRAEKRFLSPSNLFDRPVVSGLSVIIHGRQQPYGVLAAHTTRRRRFTNDDVHFLQSLASVLAAAIERRKLEEELLSISSNEQRRIGQDLHDGLCQHLAGVEFKTAALAKQLAPRPDERWQHAASIVELIRDGARQAWMLARGLSPVTLESQNSCLRSGN